MGHCWGWDQVFAHRPCSQHHSILMTFLGNSQCFPLSPEIISALQEKYTILENWWIKGNEARQGLGTIVGKKDLPAPRWHGLQEEARRDWFFLPSLSLNSGCWGLCGFVKGDEGTCWPQSGSFLWVPSTLTQEWKTGLCCLWWSHTLGTKSREIKQKEAGFQT